MSNEMIELTHEELSLLVFALEGDKTAPESGDPSCEEACPIVEHFEAHFNGGEIPLDVRLVRHLNNHLREGLIESGVFELLASTHQRANTALSGQERARLDEAHERLSRWSCQVRLENTERRFLSEVMSRLPRSAWISMPRTLWRLKRKLKS
jgi:hypothetical protein